jgi:hypothetical protein
MPRGRPITHNVKANKNEYFREYYHSSNGEYICECGVRCLLNSKRKHLMSKKHAHYMELKNTKDELNEMKKIES